MPIKLFARGVGTYPSDRIIAKITTNGIDDIDKRADYTYLVRNDQSISAEESNFSGYAAILFEGQSHERTFPRSSVPCIHGLGDLSHIRDGYIVGIEPRTGYLRILYRQDSQNNTIFATDSCNSNCLMCSQPPKEVDNSELTKHHLRLIALIDDAPKAIGITGGEPTLLKDGLIEIIASLKERLPQTHLHMLTNGRLYAYEDLVRSLASVGHGDFVSAIPLYSDVASHHDYIVQAKGAFDQTIQGLYNAAKYGLRIELRIVLHKQTIPRLNNLVSYIYRNLPFVSHVALMGLENMGYVKKNWELLWIDPVDYASELESAVRYLFLRRMNVSIYNLQLCVLPRSLWKFARRSISDYKNIYLDECAKCDLREECGGLFKSGESRHSRAIKALRVNDLATIAVADPSAPDNNRSSGW